MFWRGILTKNPLHRFNCLTIWRYFWVLLEDGVTFLLEELAERLDQFGEGFGIDGLLILSQLLHRPLWVIGKLI